MEAMEASVVVGGSFYVEDSVDVSTTSMEALTWKLVEASTTSTEAFTTSIELHKLVEACTTSIEFHT